MTRKEVAKDSLVAGVDEAGRGALAGPVVAAAVILNPNFKNEFGITDSKKLTPRKREELYKVVQENSVSVGIGFVYNEEIDRINILQAAQKAMKEAVDALSPKPNKLLIDGNYYKYDEIPFETIVKGDLKRLEISAASIIAKVSRDNWMIEKAQSQFPLYGFSGHKGYAVKKHYEALEKYGVCAIHRKTFLKKYFSKNRSLF